MTDLETNLLHLLDRGMVEEIVNGMQDLEIGEDATMDDLLPHVLLDERCQLLGDILMQLQYYDVSKWGMLSKEELYTSLLSDVEELMTSCTVKELKIICKTMEHHTDRIWFPSGVLKGGHVNTIVRAFGAKRVVDETTT